MDTPLSQSNVSLKLAEIQKRCADLIEGEADATELTLEEPLEDAKDQDQYCIER